MFSKKGPVVYAERSCCFSRKVLMFFMNRMLKGNADTSRQFLDTIETFIVFRRYILKNFVNLSTSVCARLRIRMCRAIRANV